MPEYSPPTGVAPSNKNGSSLLHTNMLSGQVTSGNGFTVKLNDSVASKQGSYAYAFNVILTSPKYVLLSTKSVSANSPASTGTTSHSSVSEYKI